MKEVAKTIIVFCSLFPILLRYLHKTAHESYQKRKKGKSYFLFLRNNAAMAAMIITMAAPTAM
jgi:hypothetical protein